ncbi:peptidoglycan glycosyltransferase [Candidatus Moduliflexus flocculans]|uniref:beta-lactamase n=1 Tax=Candidatus Moduliflexus flocculans TaxID=1499966 RepID=A0A0S6VU98_9BACT|nr:peptidoglycan glycosyltransferase [Candidatus Moduliflexus flocculans]
MKYLLRFEHWIIQRCRFDRMSNNLFWLAALLLPFILAQMGWLLHLHAREGIEYLVDRNLGFTRRAAEIYRRDDGMHFRPLSAQLLVNFKPVSKSVKLAENDQIVIGRTIFQAKELESWTPHLRTIGYYLTERDLSGGASFGRSIHPEEANQWQTNDVIVQDTDFEPVHFKLFAAGDNQYRIVNMGQKGVFIPAAPPTDGKKRKTNAPEWTQVTTEATVQAGQRIKIENTILELTPIPSREALALTIVRGAQPILTLSRNNANVIGGVSLFPKDYIPDHLVDERFLEYARQAIEAGLFGLDDPATRKDAPQLRIRGFDATGKLVSAEFEKLTDKQKFLLHQIFRFREAQGQALRWKRPFNREGDDPYLFYPDQTENFIISEKTNTVKNIYTYAAHLTNPHVIAEEIATTRGEIFDRNQFSYPRLVAYSNNAPVAELLLVPSDDLRTGQTFDTQKEADTAVYVASRYQFPDGVSVVNEHGVIRYAAKGQQTTLKNGQEFTSGRYVFRFAANDKGVLAKNTADGRYYPLGSRLAHIIGYSFAKSQFKGQLEEVFDKVLLGQEKRQPWWSLRRTVERTPGNNLILTLDDDMQRVVTAELAKKLTELNTRFKTNQFKGAALLMNKEGEVLASASLPSYNPNDLRSIFAAMQESSEDHWNSSYINRATHKSYPPGSTMKVIMSTIALDNKAQFLLPIGDGQYFINDGGRPFSCTGYLDSFRGVSFGKYGIPDFRGSGAHGQLTLDTALTKSCNNTFAFIALSAGWEMIQKYAERFGFNRSFDFLPYEFFKDDPQIVGGVKREALDPLASLRSQVPTPKEELKPTQLGRIGIGQWEVQATPLQMATVAMTVGNLGMRPFPHLLAGIEDLKEQKIRWFPLPPKTEVFSKDVMAELFPMMHHVVLQGSATRITRSTIQYYPLKEQVAGKTGTAEVEDQSGKKYNVIWFISFAPIENPQLALAIVIERGPVISGETVDVARGIWEKAILLFPELFPTPNAPAPQAPPNPA